MEPAGGLVAACLAVRAPGPEVCRVCCGALEEPFDDCWSCRQVERGLEQNLRPLTPISLAKRGSGLYTALRQYKGRPNSIALRQQNRLAELLSAFLEHHLRCVAPDGVDIVTVVPSSQVPAEAHPLVATLRMVPDVTDLVAEVLFAGSTRRTGAAAVDRNVGDAGAYSCEDEVVGGRRVLLVDDVYTTGAHMQSAAAVLADAGARSVSLLAVARFLDPRWSPARRLLERSASGRDPWTVTRCPRCTT